MYTQNESEIVGVSPFLSLRSLLWRSLLFLSLLLWLFYIGMSGAL